VTTLSKEALTVILNQLSQITLKTHQLQLFTFQFKRTQTQLSGFFMTGSVSTKVSASSSSKSNHSQIFRNGKTIF
jgi:hypothetical protein